MDSIENLLENCNTLKEVFSLVKEKELTIDPQKIRSNLGFNVLASKEDYMLITLCAKTQESPQKEFRTKDAKLLNKKYGGSFVMPYNSPTEYYTIQ